MTDPAGSSRLDAVLEFGLIAVVVVAPLPFGSVGAPGRLTLELGSFLLLALWAAGGACRGPCPGTPGRLAACGLLLLAVVQIVPIGHGAVDALSPEAGRLRERTSATGVARDAETRLLGADPESLDPVATLSVAPRRTASALRTGGALIALWLVSTTVVARRGPRRLATALALSAAFQAIYGIAVLATGHDAIWHVKKLYYLDSATGTFVNRNHFANFVAVGVVAGAALTISIARRVRSPGRPQVATWLGRRGVPVILLGSAVIVGIAGLLLSMSRTGIALGVLALVWIGLRAGRLPVRNRLVPIALIAAVAAVPLLQIGADRLTTRYARSMDQLIGPGHRVTVWRDSLEIAARYPVVGAGFGTFAEVYPAYRSPEVRMYWDHVHSDPLQHVVEGGAVGAILLVAFLIPIGRRIVRGLAGADGTVGIGIAAGLAIVLLHSLVDFPFHIPADAAVAVVLAGTLEGLAWRTDR